MKPTVLAVLAVLVIAGCGGSAGLPRKTIAKKANAICAKFSKRGANLGSPDLRDSAKAETYFTKAKALTADQQKELEGLTPDEKVKKDYTAMTDATGEVTTLLGDLAAAAKSSDQKKLVAAIQKLTPLSAKVDKTASAVGADDCAG